MHRRTFIRHAATSAIAYRLTDSTPAKQSHANDTDDILWDDSWTRAGRAKHRLVFDCAELQNGLVLNQIYSILQDYHTVLHTHDDDVHAVLVVRHRAVPMIFDDYLWRALNLRKLFPGDSSSDASAQQINPFLTNQGTSQAALYVPPTGLVGLQKRGLIVLACYEAIEGYAPELASVSGGDLASARSTLKEHLVSGTIPQPNGTYALLRAQDAGGALYRM